MGKGRTRQPATLHLTVAKKAETLRVKVRELEETLGYLREAWSTPPWLPEQIEAVTSKYALEGHPPSLEDVPEWTDILIAKKCKAKARAKDTAMAKRRAA